MEPNAERSTRPLIASVYISDAGLAGRLSRVEAFGMFRRCSDSVFRSVIPHIIRAIGRSEFAHCSIAYDGAVLDPTVWGDHVYAEAVFLEIYPRLAWRFEVPLLRPVDFEGYQLVKEERPKMPTLRRMMSKGRTPADNCVTVCCGLLRDAGVRLSPRISTPAAMYDALRRLGCNQEDVSHGLS